MTNIFLLCYTLNKNANDVEKGAAMIFCNAVCFDITVYGKKSYAEKLVCYLKSGEFDEFFEINNDLFLFEDDYETTDSDGEVRFLFSSDEFGIEVREFDSDEFLELLCKAGKFLHLSGNIYNFDDDEIRFISDIGNDYYNSGDGIDIFNDELDREALKEEEDSKDSESEDS